MTRKEKFKSLVSPERTNTIERNRERIKNRARLRESQDIAIKVLDKLDVLGWSQKKLAEKMNVTPQQISKIVKGKENLTLESQIKLQETLDIPVLASYYEKKFIGLTSSVFIKDTEEYKLAKPQSYKNEDAVLFASKSLVNNYCTVAEEFQPYELTA